MADCTDAERELLDAVLSGVNIRDARIKHAKATRDPRAFEVAARAWCASTEATRQRDEALERYMDGLGGSNHPAYYELQEMVETEAIRLMAVKLKLEGK